MDIDVVRALNHAAMYQHTNKPPWRAVKVRGITVICGRPNKPWGSSIHSSALLNHVPIGVYTAWKNGRLLGQLVRWRCGRTVKKFLLTDNPTLQVCHMCAWMTGQRIRSGISVTRWWQES